VTFEDLRVFTAACEATSLAAVARAFGRSQPAVAQHVARLERELGVALLERSRRGIAPTAAGRVLYRATSAGLGALEQALRELSRLRDGDAGRLAIATGGTTVRHFLRDAVQRFRRRHPEAALHFEPARSSQECLDVVARRAADLAFVTIADDAPGFEQWPVLEQPLMLLVRRDDRRARLASVGVRALAAIRWISLGAATASHARIAAELAREGVELVPSARVDDFDTANLFVELGLGEAIVPAVWCRSFERGGRVRAVRIRGLPPIRVGFAARSFAVLPPLALEFVGVAYESAGQWRDLPGVRRFEPPGDLPSPPVGPGRSRLLRSER
jgi:DNA-binding transcriptional LysR family regulator